jgi:adenosylhomocysteine nucleosidase
VPIHIVGIGKVNAAVNTTRLIKEHNPDIVINFGSCGSVQDYKIGEVLEIGTAVNDFDGAGTVEFEPIVFNDNAKLRCFTTDSFFNKNSSTYTHQYLNLIESCDVVDMEVYSIAVSCLLEEKSLYCYKWVSDDGDSRNWLKNAALGFDNFKKIFKENYL